LIDNISVVIIAKNPAKSIKPLLESLKEFKEVLIYLNDTTDNSKEIIENFHNVKVIEGEFKGFGPTKNHAATHAKNSWILSLDADEVLSTTMTKEIKNLKLDNSKVYEIKRYNYYKNRKIKHCGWGEEKIVRLYNKDITTFNNNLVHENIITDNLKIETINGELKHYPYNSISQFVQKADYYSEIFAKENRGKKSSSPLKAFLNATFSFIKTYIFKKGFLDGYVGLLISVSHATTNFYKYLKLYELNQEAK
jgi:glycosyltransferase involved in cell wall biosynthesis